MSAPSSEMHSALRRVRGLGAARSGTQHFWRSRVTSVFGIFLTIIGVVIVFAVLGRNHAGAVQILGSPLVVIFGLLFVANMTYHGYLGMQVVIEDYVHAHVWKYVLLILNMFCSVLTASFSAYALLKLSFGV